MQVVKDLTQNQPVAGLDCEKKQQNQPISVCADKKYVDRKKDKESEGLRDVLITVLLLLSMFLYTWPPEVVVHSAESVYQQPDSKVLEEQVLCPMS